MDTEQYEILLIEDSEYEAELTFKALAVKMPTIRYKHIRNGEDALDFLLRRASYEEQFYKLPLLILLDLGIPKVPGMKVLEEIKSHVTLRSIPVIMLTVSTNHEHMIHAYASGANSFIIKPMNFVKYSLIVAEIVHYWLLINDLPDYHKPQGRGIL